MNVEGKRKAPADAGAGNAHPEESDRAHLMKQRIEDLTIELLVRQGYQGFRFQDIADALNITRTAIHYYCGSKEQLCETVIVNYVSTLLAGWERNWTEDKPFEAKICGMMEANRARFLAFNEDLHGGNSWSLISRMRSDRDQIGPQARAAVINFGNDLERIIVGAVDQAVARGEYRSDIPRRDVALQLVAIADSAGAITRDGSGFERLEQLYRSFGHIIQHAYGATD